MFWKYNSPANNYIDTLLSKADVTLQELMDEEDILQECKSQNKKLIEFLGRPDIMEQLVTLTTVEPDLNIDERERFKYPNIACELLTCDVPPLNERLATDETLGKLYAFLEGEPPLNPLLASFFSKTLGILIARKSEQHWFAYQIICLKVLEFLKTKENCISLLLKHLGTSAIMDIMLKLMTQIEGVEMQKNLFSWLESQHVIPNLIGLLSPAVDSERHCNVSQLLCDVIRKLRENVTNTSEPDPILNMIESPSTAEQLLDCMLGTEKSESSIVGGIAVLLTLIEPARPRPGGQEASMYTTMAGIGGIEDTTARTDGGGPPPAVKSAAAVNLPPVVKSTVSVIIPRLKDLHDLLLNPPAKPAVKTTVGTLDPPLGNTRLQVARLLSALVATNSTAVNQELASLGTIEVLLDLFFKYQWNNFLHTQVEQLLAYALNELPVGSYSEDEEAPNLILIDNILVKCNLLQKILDVWEDNEKNEIQEGSQRRGYMGHVIKIANVITNQVNSTILKEKIPSSTMATWEEFVSTKLAQVNSAHNIVLGGATPMQSAGSDEEKFEIAFPSDRRLRQAYNDYQLQEMAPTYIDMYGYHDNDFNDGEDTLHSSVDRLPGMTFRLSEEDLDRRYELFKVLCSKKVNSLEDAEENAWEDTWTGSFNTTEITPSKWTSEKDGPENSSSDEEDDDEDPADTAVEGLKKENPQRKKIPMDVDTSDMWSSKTSTIPVADFGNPWGSGEPTTPQDSAFAGSDGWADFSSFESSFNNSTELDDGKSSQSIAFSNEAAKLPEDSTDEKESTSASESAAVPARTTPPSFDSAVATPSEGSAAKDAVLASGFSETSRLVVESDANANPTTCIEEVTPTATAIIDEVASAAAAAVSAAVVDKAELDNQSFLEDVRQDDEKEGSASRTIAVADPVPVEEVPEASVQDNNEKREAECSTTEEVSSEAA